MDMTDALSRQQPGAPSVDGLRLPSPVYLTGEDKLRVTAYTNTASVILSVVGRILRPDSTPTPIGETIAPSSARTAVTRTFQLSEGWLLGLGIAPAAGVSSLGVTWVQVDLIRGDGLAAQLVQSLGYGFITARNNFAWPQSGNQLSTDGPGALRSITGATPAAGGEISETVPSGARWELISISWLLTTSVTVANRSPNLIFDDGSAVYFRANLVTPIAASLASQNTFGQGLGQFTSANNVRLTSGLPVNNRLGAGHRIRTNTDNIQAADQYSAIQYLVREWLEGA